MRFCPRIRSLHRQRIYCADPARALYYEQWDRISALEVYDPVNACSCLTLILACMVYGQAREISPIEPLRTSRSTPTCCLMSARSSGTTSSSTARSRSTPPSSSCACLGVYFCTNRVGTLPCSSGGAGGGFQTNERARNTVIPQGRGPQGSGHRYRYTPDRQSFHLVFHSAHRHRF